MSAIINTIFNMALLASPAFAEATYNNCVVVCSQPNFNGQNYCHVWGFDEHGVPKVINRQLYTRHPDVSVESALNVLRNKRALGVCTSTGNPVVQY